MDTPDVVDTVIGLLANFIQTASLFVALGVFFFSPQRKAAVATRVLKVAEWATTHSLLQWLRLPAKRASQAMRRYYGMRGRRTKISLNGLLSEESWFASTHLATVYLTFGLPILGMIYLVISPSVKLGATSRAIVFGSVAVIVGSIWAAKLLARPQRQKSNGQKFALFCRALVVGVGIPAFIFNNGLVDAQAKAANPESIGSLAFLVGTVTLFAVTYLYTTAALLVIFRRWLPLGLAAYLIISIFVSRATTGIIRTEDAAINGHLDRVGVILIILGCLCLKTKSKFSVRNIPFFAGLLGLTIFSCPFLKAIYVLGFDALFEPVVGPFSVVSANIVFGTLVVTIASLVYANGLCDWLSVACTRFLLIGLLRAESYAKYIRLLFVDVLLAVLLCVGTYVVFVGLTHVYYSAVQLPLWLYLHELRDFPLSLALFDSVGRSAVSGPPDFWVTVGKAVKYFVFLFSLTALVPTLFHVLLTVFFVGGHTLAPVFAKPAAALLNRHREMQEEGDFAGKVFNYLVTYAVTMAVMFVAYAAYKLFRIYS